MMTSPGIDALIEGVILGIGNELMPFLSNEKAQASAAMMQSLLQGVRQLLPVYEQSLISEHNAMTATLRSVALLLADVAGPEAERIRERGASEGQRADAPDTVVIAGVAEAHRELGQALEASVSDLDVLQRAGGPDALKADAALAEIRAYLTPTYLNLYQAMTVGGGFLGRS